MGHCLMMRKGETHTIPGQYNITVSASDTQGYLNTLIVQRGVLTVGGYTITEANTELQVDGSSLVITYKMTDSISSPRTVKVNGASIGKAGAAGDVLTTTITVQNGDTVTIEFTS